jgi:NDP-sugar pyrophosphorylase family protein
MDLVVLAAGMGSRFGGLKQIQPIDKDENFIIDYSVYDAIKAGFDRVIFIIKEENLYIFKSTIGNRLEKIIDVEYVFQRLEDVPAGTVIPESRIKPWGTAHAIYAVKDIVSDRFAIINADDFYGYESFQIVADYLKNNSDDEFANIGYYVRNTLSDKGAVKRGVLHSRDGVVESLIESNVERRDDGKIYATPIDLDDWKVVEEDTLVSMNMFGFTDKLMDRLERETEAFFANANLNKAEFLIPEVVDRMVQDGEVRLIVESTPSKWYGITYKEDLEDFKVAVEKMKAEGQYPEHLYN